jgi:hypothetical protein
MSQLSIECQNTAPSNQKYNILFQIKGLLDTYDSLKFLTIPDVLVKFLEDWKLFEGQIELLKVEKYTDNEILTASFILLLGKEEMPSDALALIISVFVKSNLSPRNILALSDIEFKNYFESVEKCLEEGSKSFQISLEKAKETFKQVDIFFTEKRKTENAGRGQQSEDYKTFEDFQKKTAAASEKVKLIKYFEVMELKMKFTFSKFVQKLLSLDQCFTVKDFEINTTEKTKNMTTDTQLTKLVKFIDALLLALDENYDKESKNYSEFKESVAERINQNFKVTRRTDDVDKKYECKVCKFIGDSKRMCCFRGCVHLFKNMTLNRAPLFRPNEIDSKKKKGSDMKTSNPKKKSKNDGTSAIVIRNVQSVMQNQHCPTQVDQPFYSGTDAFTEDLFQEESQFDPFSFENDYFF